MNDEAFAKLLDTIITMDSKLIEASAELDGLMKKASTPMTVCRFSQIHGALADRKGLQRTICFLEQEATDLMSEIQALKAELAKYLPDHLVYIHKKDGKSYRVWQSLGRAYVESASTTSS